MIGLHIMARSLMTFSCYGASW